MSKSLIFAIVLFSILLYSCASDTQDNTGIECIQDSDCTGNSCCHPDSCVPKASAPDCTGLLCTQECAPGTLDCGQGRCVCQNNKCKAEFI